ncbi:MAG: TerB N-terminal domain-containing protein [Collinsella sp.]
MLTSRFSKPVVRCRISFPTSIARCAKYRAGRMTPKAVGDAGFRKPSSSTAMACRWRTLRTIAPITVRSPYFPTYNAMSDRQLRGYFTWRARACRSRRRNVYVLCLPVSELICGIGVDNP